MSLITMKKFAFILPLCILASGAIAQKKEKTEVKCPVMPAVKVKVADAVKTKKFYDYKGRRYVFCCDHCVTMFKKTPEKYKNAESVPIPKKKK